MTKDQDAILFHHNVSRDIQHTEEKGRSVFKLVFEGVKCKSTLTSATYQRLVYACTSSNEILDGCYYIHYDIGIFSTSLDRDYIYHMAKIVELMKQCNFVLDKFHLADDVYQQ